MNVGRNNNKWLPTYREFHTAGFLADVLFIPEEEAIEVVKPAMCSHNLLFPETRSLMVQFNFSEWSALHSVIFIALLRTLAFMIKKIFRFSLLNLFFKNIKLDRRGTTIIYGG